MLKSKYFLHNFSRKLSVGAPSFSSKATEKMLGYHEKPNEFEITSDCIGKNRNLLFFDDSYVKKFVGPPDKKSNIRPILRCIPLNETELQQRVRLRRNEVQSWVDKFWKNHNKRFFTEKDDFIQLHKKAGEENVPADKMSEFYKAFLDKNWKVHVFFNLSWYIKNFELLFLAIQLNLEQSLRKFLRK